MQIAAAMTEMDYFDFRPMLRTDGMDILIDTGAMVSVWPRPKNTPHDPTFSLEAVNKTIIHT